MTAARGVPAKNIWGLVEASIEELIWEVMRATLAQKRGKETLPPKEKLRPEVEDMRKREQKALRLICKRRGEDDEEW